ncbi:hypothetical protein FRC0061_00048 [Corynebacterium diphtheriae]|nr:hypothetical protein FRC0061_00048 [Corynebacterium diphtheriae]
MNSPANRVSAVGKRQPLHVPPRQTACREVQEEVGLTLIDAHLREPTVAAEIAECVWVDPCHPTKPLAPCCPKSPSVSNFCTLSAIFEGASCDFAALGCKNCSRARWEGGIVERHPDLTR